MKSTKNQFLPFTLLPTHLPNQPFLLGYQLNVVPFFFSINVSFSIGKKLPSPSAINTNQSNQPNQQSFISLVRPIRLFSLPFPVSFLHYKPGCTVKISAKITCYPALFSLPIWSIWKCVPELVELHRCKWICPTVTVKFVTFGCVDMVFPVNKGEFGKF
jgi:hypothetical protein